MSARKAADKVILGIGILVAVVMVGLIGWALLDTVSGPEKDAEKACKATVEEDLKAPSTAEWSDVTVSGTDDDLMVTGKVDAENEFGAMLRGDFRCAVVGGEVTEYYIDGLD